MAEIKALGKRPCPECGGEMEWNAAKQALACPYCGFVPQQQPARGEGNGAAVEHDLEDALANVDSAHRGYGLTVVKVKCQSCQAVSVFEPGRVAQRCDFCGSPSIAPYEETRDAITPESLLPVRIDEPKVRDLLKGWYASRWFAPDRLKGGALTDTLHAIYLPYWTFDARVDASWTAESGEYYYTTRTRRLANGQTVNERERQVRWYPSSGHKSHFFDDALVSGSMGVRGDLLRQIEPFPTAELAPYDPAFVRGWTVERYQVDLRQASQTSRERMQEEITAMCEGGVPGDTHRNLQVHANFNDRTFKHILVPVWLVTYTFGSKTFQTLVNGFTGSVAGDQPVSWVKVFFYVILPLVIAAIVFMVTQQK